MSARGCDMKVVKAEKKILVVEDEEHLTKLLKSRLLLNRFVVLTAQDGQEGLEIARRELPDLIILDVLLPRMNGHEMLKAIQEDKGPIRNTPVIVMSAVSAMKEQFQNLKIHAFVPKPFQPDEFISQVKKVVQPSS